VGAARESRKGAAPKKKYFTPELVNSKFDSVSLVIKIRAACLPRGDWFRRRLLGGDGTTATSRVIVCDENHLAFKCTYLSIIRKRECVFSC
jgi:hypothetical protein